jgi:hypothetical protein
VDVSLTPANPRDQRLAFVRVDLCCNDPRNGSFAGELVGVAVADQVIHLETPYAIEPDARMPPGAPMCRGKRWVSIDDGTHVHMYRVAAYHVWVGNWCWDQAVMGWCDVERLLDQLRRLGWQCVEAESRLYRAWDSGEPLRDPLREALIGP